MTKNTAGAALDPVPQWGIEGDDLDQMQGLLWQSFHAVAKRRNPAVLRLLEGKAPATTPDNGDLQAIGIWFQLLAIAEENAAMCARRPLEGEGGPDALVGSFSPVLKDIAALGEEPEVVADLLDSALIVPTLTAHPTEAKRVTVLKIHRRIYRLLTELEQGRWTPRERELLTAALRREIDLLWLTDELRLERPGVEEVAWGLHFSVVLYEATSILLERCEAAMARHFPERPAKKAMLLRFGSWIGGDRDGNPNVTAEITRQALTEARDLALQHIEACLPGASGSAAAERQGQGDQGRQSQRALPPVFRRLYPAFEAPAAKRPGRAGGRHLPQSPRSGAGPSAGRTQPARSGSA